MSYSPQLIGTINSIANVLIGGDTCHSTMGALKSDEVYLLNPCTEGSAIGALNTGLEAIYVRGEPPDALDLRDCVVPHARQADWDSMDFIGNAMSLDASGCGCQTGGFNYWNYDFTEYQASNGDTYWYGNPSADQFGTGNWKFDPYSSFILHHAGATPYFEIQVWCIYDSSGLVWSGEKQCGHDPDGSYARTGGCDSQDPLVWNKN